MTPSGALDRARPAALSGRVVRGRYAVLELGPSWDDLLARSARTATPFVARGWLAPWIEDARASETPVAFTAWDWERLVALLVVVVRRRRGVRVAQAPAAPHPGYHGLLLEDGRTDAVDVIADLCASRADFDALVLPDLSDLDEPTAALVRGLSSRRFAVARAFRNPCHAVALDVGYGAFLRARKSGKSVKNLRRDERRLRDAGDVELLHLVGPEITADAVRRAAAVQRASWMRRRGAAVLSGGFHERLALSAARAGLAHLWIVSIDGDDAAFGYALLLHGRMHFVWTAFDLRFERLSVGRTLAAWILRDACAAGARAFDFGHGDADYKRFWSSGAHRVDRVALGRGARGAAYVAACAAAWRLARVGWIRAAFRAVVPRG